MYSPAQLNYWGYWIGQPSLFTSQVLIGENGIIIFVEACKSADRANTNSDIVVSLLTHV